MTPIGIDLGTTHTVIACFEDDGPRVLEGPDGALLPSVVALDEHDHLLVGASARERLLAGLPHSFARFKSAMGTPGDGKGRLDPTALSALVLREAKRIASEQLGEPVERAVISVPAWFREAQRRATVEAAHLAGLQVLRLVNEPTAAALNHGLGVDDELQTVAVLDLGGGTFDITLVELYDGVADVLASVGDTALGGEDATDRLLAEVLTRLDTPPLDPALRAQLRDQVEQAKRRLSSEPHCTLRWADQSLRLDRDDLDAALRPWTDRLRACIGQLRGQAGWTTPDHLLLVGGAARMPLVRRLAEQVLDVKALPYRDGDTGIALGAAVQAGLVLRHRALEDRLMSDVLTHSLGVDTHRQVDGVLLGDRFDALLSRGTTLPATATSRYVTLNPEQTHVSFAIFEGEDRVASRNHLLGQLEVQVEPGSLRSVEVRFTHDVSGLLEVEAEVDGGARERLVLQRSGLDVDEEAQQERLAALDALKVHPRDLLPNRLAIERGNRVVRLSSGPERELLVGLLDGLEAAMERRDDEAILHYRGRVLATCAARLDAIGLGEPT